MQIYIIGRGPWARTNHIDDIKYIGSYGMFRERPRAMTKTNNATSLRVVP
eukprot:SAG11_NODE_41164_length_197_cov_30.173469_1_plen_49_part_10